MGLEHWKFPREKTAIHHPRNLSIAVSRGIQKGIIKPCSIIFDYGCGYGDDIRVLRARGYKYIKGWDPAVQLRAKHWPEEAANQTAGIFYTHYMLTEAANVVILSNVINVIERVKERKDVLRQALTLATECLIVSAYNGATGTPWGDGIKTRKGTFQKPYSKAGFRRFLRNTLGGLCKKIEFHPTANLAFVWKKEVPGP